jgi:predicted thioesterase
MIGLMETAAFRALQPYCEGDEITVGTAINIEHRAATGVGALVKAEARLESANGRFFVFRVRARDDSPEIGRGTVSRAVVSLSKFMQRMTKSSH